jgi:hypothetical protein
LKTKRKIYLLVFLLLFSLTGIAQTYTAQEIKAGYLLNIPAFVSFPNKSDKESVIIAIYGKDPFGELLRVMLSEKKGLKPHLFYYKTLEDLQNANYNILYIAGIPKSELVKLLEITKAKNVLTIGDDIPDFCELGGIINFEKNPSGKIFTVNLSEALRKAVTIDPKLLILAKVVNY